MSDTARDLLWTWAPLVIPGGALFVFACMHDRRWLSCLILLANWWAGYRFGASLDIQYSFWAAVGFSCIDYVTAVLLLAWGETRVAVLMWVSAVLHVAFGIHEMIPHGTSNDAQMALYYSRLIYGWTAFSLTLLSVALLAGGDHGGGGRRDKGPNRRRSDIRLDSRLCGVRFSHGESRRANPTF